MPLPPPSRTSALIPPLHCSPVSPRSSQEGPTNAIVTYRPGNRRWEYAKFVFRSTVFTMGMPCRLAAHVTSRRAESATHFTLPYVSTIREQSRSSTTSGCSTSTSQTRTCSRSRRPSRRRIRCAASSRRFCTAPPHRQEWRPICGHPEAVAEWPSGRVAGPTKCHRFRCVCLAPCRHHDRQRQRARDAGLSRRLRAALLRADAARRQPCVVGGVAGGRTPPTPLCVVCPLTQPSRRRRSSSSCPTSRRSSAPPLRTPPPAGRRCRTRRGGCAS